MTTHQINGMHFVGSVPLSSSRETFQRLTTYFPASVLKRIPDGETGGHNRYYWIACQIPIFRHHPGSTVLDGWTLPENPSVPDPGMKESDIHLAQTGYYDAAIASYSEFCKLRDQGVIKKGQRFQVSLPTPAAVLMFVVLPPWKQIMERPYVQALKDALHKIQDAIPAEDLAIQWDVAAEIAYLEDCGPMPIWFDDPLKKSLLDRISEMLACVKPDVPMGIHLCYGDHFHKHFKQPQDLSLLVDVANILIEQCPRTVDFLHMPVPPERDDQAYFRPLTNLKAPDSELYLGLLHAEENEKGALRRIKTASEFWPRFGIASECGYGRCTIPEWESQMENARAILLDETRSTRTSTYKSIIGYLRKIASPFVWTGTALSLVLMAMYSKTIRKSKIFNLRR